MRRQSEPLDHQEPPKPEKSQNQTPGPDNRYRHRDYAERREDYRDDDR